MLVYIYCISGSASLYECLLQGYVVIHCGQACFSFVPTNSCSGVYLQGESNDFETLLHCIKLLLVEGVVHYVRS